MIGYSLLEPIDRHKSLLKTFWQWTELRHVMAIIIAKLFTSVLKRSWVLITQSWMFYGHTCWSTSDFNFSTNVDIFHPSPILKACTTSQNLTCFLLSTCILLFVATSLLLLINANGVGDCERTCPSLSRDFSTSLCLKTSDTADMYSFKLTFFKMLLI